MPFEITNMRLSKLFLFVMLLLNGFFVTAWAQNSRRDGTIVPDEFGYINKRGNLVFRLPRAVESENFSDGLLKIKRQRGNDEPKTSYLNRNGDTVVEETISGDRFSEGLAKAGQRGKIGFVDKSGRVVIPQIFTDALCFREGFAPVMINKGYGFIDRSGKVVVEPFFENAIGFSEGLAAVQSQGAIGFIDKTGKWQIKPQFDYVNGFSDGMALVGAGDVEFYIDRDGRQVIKLGQELKKRPFVPWGVSEAGLSSLSPFLHGFNVGIFASPCAFKDGLSPMYRDQKYGYINKMGKFVIPPKFQLAFPFVEGLASVCVDDKYGFIDKAGEFVVQPKFSKAKDFSEGAAAVAVGHNKWGFINTKGNFIVKPKYIFVGPFNSGRAHVQLAGCYQDDIESENR